jgi:hypothetical protein
MSEVRSLFANHSFQNKCHEAYGRMIQEHDISGMEALVAWLDNNGWNTHSVVNQLTIWNKGARSPTAPRIVVDTHGAQWSGLAKNASSVHTSAFYRAYFFDVIDVLMLQEEMKNDPDCVDQSSQKTTDRAVE